MVQKYTQQVSFLCFLSIPTLPAIHAYHAKNSILSSVRNGCRIFRRTAHIVPSPARTSRFCSLFQAVNFSFSGMIILSPQSLRQPEISAGNKDNWYFRFHKLNRMQLFTPWNKWLNCSPFLLSYPNNSSLFTYLTHSFRDTNLTGYYVITTSLTAHGCHCIFTCHVATRHHGHQLWIRDSGRNCSGDITSGGSARPHHPDIAHYDPHPWSFPALHQCIYGDPRQLSRSRIYGSQYLVGDFIQPSALLHPVPAHERLIYFTA